MKEYSESLIIKTGPYEFKRIYISGERKMVLTKVQKIRKELKLSKPTRSRRKDTK